MRTILALETTCDETAAAVIREDLKVLGEVVASQEELHRQYHGVVPEIAARAHVERVLPVIHETLERAGVGLDEIDAFAVANTPGLAGSLLVGVVAAKSLSVALGKPLLAVNHLQAHIYACQMDQPEPIFPCVGFIVSGGHSELYRCRSATEFDYLGGTIDDAAGEAFDKVASMLQLPYPGGPAVSAAALKGDRNAYAFPRPFLKDKASLNFSFSGLKTAVRYAIAGTGRVDFSKLDLSDADVANVCASFEEAVVDCLVGKAELAVKAGNSSRLCVGGGVAANRRLREKLKASSEQHGYELLIAPMKLCTDNAVMGAIAFERWNAGLIESLDLDALPGLNRGGSLR